MHGGGSIRDPFKRRHRNRQGKTKGDTRAYLDFRFLRNFLIDLRRTHNRTQELFAAQLIFISATLVPLAVMNLTRGDYRSLALDIASFATIFIGYKLSFVLKNMFPLKLGMSIIYSAVIMATNLAHEHETLFFLFPFALMVATFFRRDFLWLAPALVMPSLVIPIAQHGVDRLVFMFSGSFLLFCMLLFEFFLTEEDEKNALTRLAEQDGLTGAGNRTALERVLDTYYDGKSTDGPISVLMFDVDNFKRVNDEFGHPTGDLVLARFASLVREAAAMSGRNINLYRLGGDEFCAFLFQDGDSAKGFAASIIERISRQSLIRESAVTVSVGVTEMAGGETYRDGYLRADDALLRAKAEGKARLVAG